MTVKTFGTLKEKFDEVSNLLSRIKNVLVAMEEEPKQQVSDEMWAGILCHSEADIQSNDMSLQEVIDWLEGEGYIQVICVKGDT